MVVIDVESVNKQYGDLVALDGLSVQIAEAECFGLLGPNGAGKSTTIDILTGQCIPDTGTVRVLGIDPSVKPREVRSRVGILPERESPPSFLTPREYFWFIGTVRDLPDDVVEDAISSWASRLGLTDKLDTMSTDLSRGEQQKVMIVAALFHEPAAVFIDEPLVNLDPIMQERIKDYLIEYHHQGNTVVLSTHNVEVAAQLCTTVGILYEGRLVTTVEPADLDEQTSLLDVFFEYADQAASIYE